MQPQPPAAVSQFLKELTAKNLGVNPAIEPGGVKSGDWWLDFPQFTIQWRPGRGFGFSSRTDVSYGEGPNWVSKTPRGAVSKACRLLLGKAKLTHS